MARSGRRPIVAEDLLEIAIVGDPQIAPDGRRVACVVTEIDAAANTYCSVIWAVPADRGEPRRLTAGSRREHHPRWSPDGRWLAFLSDRDAADAGSSGAPRKTQLYVLDAEAGEDADAPAARRLTFRPEGVSAFAWRPTGDRLAFVSAVRPTDLPAADEAAPPLREIARIKHKADDQGVLAGYTHLFVVSADGGDPAQVTDGDWDDSQPAWSPDGRSVAFTSNRTPDRDWNGNDVSDVWVVPAEGGSARALTRSTLVLGAPAWSPDGRLVACVESAHRAPGGANARLWVVPADGGEPRCLSADFDRSLGSDVLSDLRADIPPPVPSWSADGSRIRFVAGDRGNVHLFELDVADGLVRRLVGGDRQVLSFSVAAGEGQSIAFAATTPLDPGNVFVAAEDGADERRLTDLNRALLDALDLAAPEHLEFTGAEGEPVEGWFLSGIGAGRRPTLLQIHGGPHAQYGNAFVHEFQVLAAAGYNVVYTNPRGSRGYGERFCSAIAGAWGELDYGDLMAAVELVVARPDVDPDRLGVLGGSYGGFMTNWIVGHTDRFKAAVSMRGISNFASFYGTSDIGQTFAERELLGDPLAAAGRYARMSPISYVDRVRTPLLLLHGEQDLRCPLEQAEQLFVALRRRGRGVEFVRFPEEAHNLSRSGRPDRRLLRLDRILAWFDRWLTGELRAPSARFREDGTAPRSSEP